MILLTLPVIEESLLILVSFAHVYEFLKACKPICEYAAETVANQPNLPF